MQETYYVLHPGGVYLLADPQPISISLISETIHSMFLKDMILERLIERAKPEASLSPKEEK